MVTFGVLFKQCIGFGSCTSLKHLVFMEKDPSFMVFDVTMAHSPTCSYNSFTRLYNLLSSEK
jgi:hypothetical protein